MIATLAEIVTDPTRAVDLPAQHVPALLLQLAAAQTALAARLVSAPTLTPSSPRVDELVDVAQAATLTGRSRSWLRKHGHTIPGFIQPGGHGTRTRWSRAALLGWAGLNLADSAGTV